MAKHKLTWAPEFDEYADYVLDAREEVTKLKTALQRMHDSVVDCHEKIPDIQVRLRNAERRLLICEALLISKVSGAVVRTVDDRQDGEEARR